ncbi:MAG: rod shape-determining protein MreC [Armatimonadota bacterium]|nr:rod shape-determining protein MreC [Armatimonadota bacterium]
MTRPTGNESARNANTRVDLVSWSAQLLVRYPARALSASADWVADLGRGIRTAPSLSRRAKFLEEANAMYSADRVQIETLRNDLAEARTLAKLPERATYKKVPVDILGYFPEGHRILITAGSNRMVKPGAPVICAGGLVGQVVEVSPDSAYVNLLTHSDFSVGARVVRQTSQEAGIASGQASAQLLLGVYTETTAVQPGDLITTSGLSTIYPEGIAIGHATKVWHNKNLGIQEALISPVVEIRKIRHAVVLVR